MTLEEIIALAEAGLSVYSKTVALVEGVKAEAGATDQAAADAALDKLHAQYESDYQAAKAALAAAAQQS